jgi:protein-S-isoprenylcysteine O-methyltransferase Ste14
MYSPFRVAATLWTVWLATWLAAAAWSARTVARQSPAERLRHGVPLSLGAILLFWRPGILAPLERPLLPPVPWVAWGAVGLVLLGLAHTWWARLHLGRMWSGNVTLKADHAIVRTGPYRITRHPIYTGLLLAALATGVIRDEVAAWLGVLLMLAGLVVKIRQEERLLEGHFGPAYAGYRSEVPALVPRLW